MKINPFVIKCILTVNFRRNYGISECARHVAEAAFRELRDGDVDVACFNGPQQKMVDGLKEILTPDKWLERYLWVE